MMRFKLVALAVVVVLAILAGRKIAAGFDAAQSARTAAFQAIEDAG